MPMKIHTPTWIARIHLSTAFLTCLPVPEVCMDSAGSLASSMSMFPLVGAAIGSFGGLIFLSASHFLGALPSALLSVAAMIIVTGALHEDGLADLADGLGAKGDKDLRLRVMRDPHVGTFGTLALVLSILLRGALLSAAPGGWTGMLTLIAAAALSRAAIPAAMQTMPPARSDGLGAGAGVPDFTVAALAAVIAINITLLCVGFAATLAAILGTAAGAALIGVTAKRTLGGFTGDVLGAIQQMSEIGILIAVACLW